MNICIFASIGSQNLGDELILKNEIKLLEQEFLQPHFSGKDKGENERSDYLEVRAKQKIEGVESGIFGENIHFKIATYDIKNIFYTQDNIEYFEYFPIDIKNIKKILRNIKNLGVFFKNIIWSDVVVIGGGGIIYDDEVQSVGNPLSQWIFRTTIARFFRKKVYFYAVGIDIKNQENNKKLKKIFKNAYKITVRDEKSLKHLQNIGITSELVDDPVMFDRRDNSGIILPQDSTHTIFSFQEKGGCKTQDNSGIISTHISKKFKISDLKNFDFKNKIVGLALRSGYFGDTSAAPSLLEGENGMSSDIQEVKLIQELCNFIEQAGGKIVFLPHSLHRSDEIANDYIFMSQFMNEKREIKSTLQEVYTVYVNGETDVNITMRLHSIILSHVYNIPQIVVSYSQKTDEIIKKLKI